MNKEQLLTYAIMTVNNNDNKDYYDNFIPFVKEALRTCGDDIISANELKKNIKTVFQLDLPINVVNTILRKRLRPQGYIKLENQRYIPNFDRLQDSNFTDIRQQMLEKHSRLTNEIIEFGNKKYGKTINEIEAEACLEKFINKYQVSLLVNSLEVSPITIDEQDDSSELDIILASYIKECEKNQSLSFEYLIDIVKGTMLTNALYYNQELNTIDMKFKGTEVYLDSSFLIYALGLAGKARQEPCTELLTMLKESNAILRVFRHNIEEIIGILEWCKNNLTSSSNDFHGTISHFISNGYNVSDIERVIFSVEKEIEEKLRIKIVDTTDYEEHQFIISEQELEHYLQQNIRYPRKNALERDVQSVSGITRLRKDKKSLHVENCRAVFITTNLSLAQNIKKYFYNEEMPRLIPPVLHDSTITNLVWLKNPSKAPDLPSKKLIAECYAATAPREHLWKRYIDALNIYERANEITQEDLVLLRYTPGARELLVDSTLGDENAVTIGTVKDILAEIKYRQETDLRELEKQKEMEIQFLKETIQQSKAEAASSIEKRELKIKDIAKSRAKLTTRGITLVISLVFGLLLYYVPAIPGLNIPSIIKISFVVMISVIPSVLGLFNINLLPVLKRMNSYFEDKYEDNLRNRYL